MQEDFNIEIKSSLKNEDKSEEDKLDFVKF